MNPITTTWFRACRPPCRNIVPKCSSSSSSSSSSMMTSFYISRAPRTQRATFSSLRPVREAQRVHENASSAVSENTVVFSGAATAPAQQSSSDLFSRATTTESIPLSAGTPSNASPPNVPTSEEEHTDATKPAKGHTVVGRVSRVGTMNKTVRVSRTVQVWDRHLRKYYKRKAHDMVHDPKNILNEGDVVEYGSAERKQTNHAPVVAGGGSNKNVKYVVHQVITPFGLPVDVRPSRTVGSPKGRWEGTAGEVIKGNVRQRGRGKSKAR